MKSLVRVIVGLLLVGTIPATAGILWIQTTDAGSLPATAQIIYGQNEPLDAIFAILTDAAGANVFQILITDPVNFTATVDSFDLNPDETNPSQVMPQIFLFDSQGFPISGDPGLLSLGHAGLPFGPDPFLFPDPAFYFLVIDTVGVDPINVETGQPLFCTVPDFIPGTDPQIPNPLAGFWEPCAGAESLPITGYQGFPLSVGLTQPDGSASTGTGGYLVQLTGVTAPDPEPGSIVLFLGGLTAVFALARKKR